MKPGPIPILCIDFDGVLHSYVSGWKGPRNIPDPPVVDKDTGKNAIGWLRALIPVGEDVCCMAPRYLDFRVCIYSSRSKYIGGRRAMKRWLMKWGMTKYEVERIHFPLFKPPAFLTIDDRAICFSGRFPLANEMLSFKTWTRKGV